MAEEMSSQVRDRCAIVTGANKGIGFEICRQLASKGIMVVLTARDEKGGREALERLKDLGVTNVIFHQLDVTDPTSVASLFDFINTRFQKLDILINNAAILGVDGDASAIGEKMLELASRASSLDFSYEGEIQSNAAATCIEKYELAEKCLETNYYGAKRMIEAFVPLLHHSDLPRIVIVSSSRGKLKFIFNRWAIDVLSDGESLTEERVEKVLNKFLTNFKEGSLQENRWPLCFPAYTVSKAALNAYTRVAAKKYQNICINCVCPGYVRTDITGHSGLKSVEEGAEDPVKVALLPDGGPSGVFFVDHDVSFF